jgi:hypothetical protein
MNACIPQVIDSLPEDYRTALVLREHEGMTAQEIAEASRFESLESKTTYNRPAATEAISSSRTVRGIHRKENERINRYA